MNLISLEGKCFFWILKKERKKMGLKALYLAGAEENLKIEGVEIAERKKAGLFDLSKYDVLLVNTGYFQNDLEKIFLLAVDFLRNFKGKKLFGVICQSKKEEHSYRKKYPMDFSGSIKVFVEPLDYNSLSYSIEIRFKN